MVHVTVRSPGRLSDQCVHALTPIIPFQRDSPEKGALSEQHKKISRVDWFVRVTQ